MATWKGVTVDQRTADMLTGADNAEISDPFNATQGSYSTSVAASGGTHSGGGAVDIALAGLDDNAARRIETGMRKVGFAAWYRLAIPGTWPRHVHGIAVGCVDLSTSARTQVTAYKNGRDGLASNGPDTGDRSYVNVTWEAYHAAHPYVLEDVMASIGDVQDAVDHSETLKTMDGLLRDIYNKPVVPDLAQRLATIDTLLRDVYNKRDAYPVAVDTRNRLEKLEKSVAEILALVTPPASTGVLGASPSAAAQVADFRGDSDDEPMTPH